MVSRHRNGALTRSKEISTQSWAPSDNAQPEGNYTAVAKPRSELCLGATPRRNTKSSTTGQLGNRVS